jgi:hypothetical protein
MLKTKSLLIYRLEHGRLLGLANRQQIVQLLRARHLRTILALSPHALKDEKEIAFIGNSEFEELEFWARLGLESPAGAVRLKASLVRRELLHVVRPHPVPILLVFFCFLISGEVGAADPELCRRTTTLFRSL